MADKKKTDNLNLVIEQIKKQTKDPNAIMRLGDSKKLAKDIDVISSGSISINTAVGIGAAKKISLKENIVVLATAHPSKFSDVVEKATGVKPELPENLQNILVEKENYDKLPKDLEKVKNYILERI